MCETYYLTIRIACNTLLLEIRFVFTYFIFKPATNRANIVQKVKNEQDHDNINQRTRSEQPINCLDQNKLISENQQVSLQD